MLAGCGSSHPKALTATTTTPALPSLHAAVRKLYGNAYANPLYNVRPWAVVQIGRGTAAKAVVFHYVNGAWHVDRAGGPTLEILGPKPGSVQPPIMQVAITMRSKTPLVQSALWLDGVELQEKGGGLTPTRGTIYGAPTLGLPKGVHVAVGYARNTTNGSAVAWSFRVS